MDSRQGSNFNSKPGDASSERSNKSVDSSQSFSSKKTDEVEIRDGLQMGDTIGGTYTIVSFLGRGGMGQVFGVEHIMLRQTYALKILTSDSPDHISWRRFQTEARTIAKLDHPNIIKVHNLGIHDERVPYYVMDLLEGETLAAVVRREGALTPTSVLDIFIPICEGLAYAHSHGVVHRDVKPSNIMLVTRNGKTVPKVVDFGLVKLVGGTNTASQQLTATGEVFGSPLYMSPEQSVGRHINERSDIYSLGCTMFEALTGAPPFVGENPVQTIMKHQSEAPPTLKEASLGAAFAPEWEAVIARTLIKEANVRYQTIDELAHDLQCIKAGKKLSRQYASTADGDLFTSDDDVAKANAKGKQLVFVSIGLAILLTGIGAGSYVYLQQKRAAQAPHVDAFAEGGSQKGATIRVPSVESAELETTNVPFAQNGGKPVNGSKIFAFPADLSLGSISASIDPSQKALVFDAKGEVKIPANFKVTFTANRECGLYPKIFRRFGADDLDAVILPGTATDTDDELYLLNHLTNLAILNIDGTDVTAKGLRIVGEFPKLRILSLSHLNTLTGNDLAKLKNLGQLTTIYFNSGKDVSSLLKALKGSKTIQSLALENTTLSRDDIKLLATMPNLESAALTGCNLTDEDLAPLNNLPHLAKLLLRGNNLSPKFIDIFGRNQHLGWIELSPPAWSEADLERLKTTFKNRYNLRKIERFDF